MRAGEPREAVDMYTRANMYEAAHKVSKYNNVNDQVLLCENRL